MAWNDAMQWIAERAHADGAPRTVYVPADFRPSPAQIREYASLWDTIGQVEVRSARWWWPRLWRSITGAISILVASYVLFWGSGVPQVFNVQRDLARFKRGMLSSGQVEQSIYHSLLGELYDHPSNRLLLWQIERLVQDLDPVVRYMALEALDWSWQASDVLEKRAHKRAIFHQLVPAFLSLLDQPRSQVLHLLDQLVRGGFMPPEIVIPAMVQRLQEWQPSSIKTGDVTWTSNLFMWALEIPGTVSEETEQQVLQAVAFLLRTLPHDRDVLLVVDLHDGLFYRPELLSLLAAQFEHDLVLREALQALQQQVIREHVNAFLHYQQSEGQSAREVIGLALNGRLRAFVLPAIDDAQRREQIKQIVEEYRQELERQGDAGKRQAWELLRHDRRFPRFLGSTWRPSSAPEVFEPEQMGGAEAVEQAVGSARRLAGGA